MRFALGVDYELFFGASTGTVGACMIEPTDALVSILERHGAWLTAFVDAAYLVKLQNSNEQQLAYDRVARQLRWLVERGHDVQLHVHPHWLNSTWVNGGWRIDASRYRLQDFEPHDVKAMLAEQAELLTRITGQAPVAYRAGGWCVQPFEHIAHALESVGVHVDSTVYQNGLSVNPGREFNFRGAPQGDHWRFESDPLLAETVGRFLEIPISPVTVPPTFYWAMAYRKLRPQSAHRAFGDGVALTGSGAYYLRKLFAFEQGVASIDGARGTLLERALARQKRLGNTILNVMGHPKSISPASLEVLDGFLKRHDGKLEHHTIRSLASTLQA